MKNIKEKKDSLFKQFNLDNFYLFLAFCVIILFVWIRFIRGRLPHDIPFTLSFWSFIMLLLTCLLYVYLIYRVIHINKSNNMQKIFHPIITHLITPFTSLHHLMLKNTYVQKLIYSLLNIFTFILKISPQSKELLFTYMFFFIIPKILLTICLILDCFIYKQLSQIYHCVFVVTIPLLLRYLIYCMPSIKESNLSFLNEFIIIEITSNDIIYEHEDYDEQGFLYSNLERHYRSPSLLDYDDVFSFEGNPKRYKYLGLYKFIHYQSNAVLFGCNLYEYKIVFLHERKDVLDFSTHNVKPDITKVEIETLISFLIDISVLDTRINQSKKYYFRLFNTIAIVINILLMICWVYILLRSVHTLPYDAFEWFIPKYTNPSM